MILRLDRGSSAHRHSGEEISSHPSPNNELIRVQIDDDTIQKYNHHHPRPSRRRHFPNINQWSVRTITWLNLAIHVQRQRLLELQISVYMDSSIHYTSLWNELSTLHYTRLETIWSSEDITPHFYFSIRSQELVMQRTCDIMM